MKILVHICCSVDSHFFLQKMQKDFKGAELIGFFYDPNIHPYSEYYLRLLDVKRSCDILGVELIEGEYDYLGWIEATRGLENEPEKGARCSVCFDRRFEVSAIRAKELGCDYFTSTLLTSPKKSIEQLKNSGEALAKKYGVKFLTLDYRSNSGTQEQNILAKKDKLYRQNYCGCLYALKQQREQQNRLLDELFCPINKQILPASIEDRVALYQERVELEERGVDYEIVKKRILNWRLLFAKVVQKGKVVPSHIVPMSQINRSYSRGKIEKSVDNIYYFSRDEIKFVTLEYYNKILGLEYKNINELILNPPRYEDELRFREKLLKWPFDISTIIVLNSPPNGKYEIYLDAKIYQDVKDDLIKLTQ
jgi:predicted adenine nucleotide alpha hydrolase (AANH) superfamily ATPase